MNKTLYDGFVKYEFLPGNASVLQFADLKATLILLRRFQNNQEALAAFREEVGHFTSDGDHLDANQVLERFASLLVSGRVRLLRSYQPAIRSAIGEAAAGRKKEETQGVQRAPAPKKHWVEFRVVDDQTGDPIDGVQLTVRLPDGSTDIRTTDAGGYVEFVEIPGGECLVTCDMTEATLSNSLQFVRTS